MLHAGFLLGVLSNPEDGRNILLRNFGQLSIDSTALHNHSLESLSLYIRWLVMFHFLHVTGFCHEVNICVLMLANVEIKSFSFYQEILNYLIFF
jgi:hypothetical protein